jgi:hypothetical protein
MNFFKCLAFGLIGGAVGAAVWAVIAIVAQAEAGYVALGVGVLAGFAVRYAAGREEGTGPGLVAVIAAVLAIGAGKLIEVTVLVNQQQGGQVAEVAPVDDSAVLVHIARDVALMSSAANKRLSWPGGHSALNASALDHFPKEVQAEAQKRYDAMSTAARDEQRKALVETSEAATAEATASARSEALSSAFSPLSIIFDVLAIAIAFVIGSGKIGGG